MVRKHRSSSTDKRVIDIDDSEFDISQYRLVIDYRSCNEAIISEFQPLGDATSIFSQVAEVKPQFFSQFDVSNSFFQINLEEASRDATSYSTRIRHVRFCKVPQGMKIALRRG